MALVELGAVEPAADNARIEILDVAATCFMERGYAATSIDDVARRLGATKGRIYHHFASKADLFAQIFRTGMDMNFETVAPFRSMTGRAVDVWEKMAAVHVTQMILTKPFQRTVWRASKCICADRPRRSSAASSTNWSNTAPSTAISFAS